MQTENCQSKDRKGGGDLAEGIWIERSGHARQESDSGSKEEEAGLCYSKGANCSMKAAVQSDCTERVAQGYVHPISPDEAAIRTFECLGAVFHPPCLWA